MTEHQHPITPPPELVRQWENALECPDMPSQKAAYIATQAANWGDEQRLNAVCEWLHYNYPAVNCAALRSAMRPKPPSLAEEALTKIGAVLSGNPRMSTLTDILEALELSRRALERLQELGQNNG